MYITRIFSLTPKEDSDVSIVYNELDESGEYIQKRRKHNSNEVLEWISNGNEVIPYDKITFIDDITELEDAKYFALKEIRSIAYSHLQPTDWVVVRAVETGVEAPADITSFRESIRAASSTKISAIELKTDLESLKEYLRSNEYKNWPEQ